MALSPPDATVGYLPQEPDRSEHETVDDFLGRRTGVAAATEEFEAATSAMAAGEPDADDRYSSALERWLALGAADLDARIGPVWADLGLAPRLRSQTMSTLSGGEAARVGLAALLLAQFDIFLLDEPTNDLDLDGLARLEAWVAAASSPLLLVSHDREFLRRTVTHVAELDDYRHQLAVFAGGWDAFLAEREVAARHAQERYDAFADKKSTLLGRAQREREWSSQGVSKAKKKGDDNDKNIKSFKLNSSEQLAGKAARTERAIERLDVIDKPREAWQLRLSFGETARSGDVVVRLHGAVAHNGDFTLGPVDLTVNAGERIAIVGHNGAGKSTLLDLILGRRALDEGTRWFGPGVVVGELEQRRLQLSEEHSLLRSFMETTALDRSEARTLLAKFGLGATEVERPTVSLSPGERTRAVLAVLMAKGTNCLILDEPTNHLDLAAIEQLEVALDAFAGTVLIITHDRALLEAVNLTRTITVDAGQVSG